MIPLGEVSVVIPTVGRDTLAATLKSVRDQTFQPAEVIVVLDYPPAEKTVRNLLTQPNETLVVTPGKTGGSAARNLGVKKSKGKYIAFLDDDDLWDRQKIELQVKVMEEENSDWSFTGSRFMRATSLSKVYPRYNPPLDSTLLPPYMISRKHMRYGDGLIQSSSLILRRSLFDSIMWDESLGKHEDWEIVCDLASGNFTYSFVPQPLTLIRQGSLGSVSRINKSIGSLEWVNAKSHLLNQKSYSDFVFCEVLPGIPEMLRRGDFDPSKIRFVYKLRPHAAAVFVCVYKSLRSLTSSRK